MKELLFGFLALGLIVSGCAQKEEVKTETTTETTSAATTEEKGDCGKAGCKCAHHHHDKEAKCAECQKGGKECEACKMKHAGCKECASNAEAKAADKKVEKKKKAK